MKKLSKKLLAVLLAATMILAMGITSFARTNDATTITVYIQEVDTTVAPDENGDYPRDNIDIIDSVSVNTTDTIKVAVDKALAASSTDTVTNTAGWVDVPASSYGPAYTYLDSITYNGTLYNTTGTSTPEGDHTRYEGKSWAWNFSGGALDFPAQYMSQATVGSHTIIYLLYEKSSFTY